MEFNEKLNNLTEKSKLNNLIQLASFYKPLRGDAISTQIEETNCRGQASCPQDKPVMV